MHKFVTLWKNGIAASTAVLPKGTLVTDDATGKLYLHDGVTPGGEQLGGGGYTPLNKAGDTMTGLFGETTATSFTAGTTRTQAGATQLTGQINTVSTSTSSTASPFDGVKLPASAAGLEIEIINSSANPIQIYGLGSDTVDGFAATTGVIQPPNSMVEYTCAAVGTWYSEGMGVGYYVPSTNTVGASLFTESTTDGITAHSGGGQTSATQIFTQTNRITTVAAALDSVKLPPSAAGLELVLINAGANAMQVFGYGTDTIDSVATATGVTQMKGSMTIYSCPTAGAWVTNGLGTGYAASLQTMSFGDSLSAAGTNQGSATVITNSINKFSTVTSGQGAVLPAAAPGLIITIANTGANSMQVYGNGSDTINGVAATTGVAMMVNSVAMFSATATGVWLANGLGNGYSGSLATQSNATGLTAAGSTQGTALQLTAMLNQISTASASTGVLLPASAAGLQIAVINNGASTLNVYPPSGSTMNGSLNAASTLATGSVGIYFCFSSSAWVSK